MAEIRGSFGSVEEWQAWRQEFGEIRGTRQVILEDIRSRGYIEPLSGIARHPYEIVIRDKDLQESISSHETNSRKRAFLVQLVLELQERDWLTRRNLRVLGAEALSPIAMILRRRFPFYWGTEYLPDEAQRLKYFPIPHMDAQRLDYPDESFEVFAGNGVFVHTPDLDRALEEIHRVLRPGGILVAHIPFDPSRLTTMVKPPLAEAGRVAHGEPEHLGTAAGNARGHRVLQLAGWDLLPKLVAIGFEDAYFSLIASSHFGILSDANLGVFSLTASKPGGKPKPGGGPKPHNRPAGLVAKNAMPEKLCVLIALPRSGTTMLTSVFAVHSKWEAVYEPWNGKRVSGDAESRLEVICKAERLPSLSGKMLFVKETTAFKDSLRGLRILRESAPFPVEKHMLMLLRQPEHTFLSEIERRKEWWKDDVTVNAATFDNWAIRSKRALRQVLDFGIECDGIVVLLEDFAARPDEILGQLAQRIGFSVEREQLEYEKHLDKRRVRGDLNVSGNPTQISTHLTTSRSDKTAALEGLIIGSSHAEWFAAFRSLYAVIHAHGGIMRLRDIPKPVIAALHPAKKGVAPG